jgi:hypothetical protein
MVLDQVGNVARSVPRGFLTRARPRHGARRPPAFLRPTRVARAP